MQVNRYLITHESLPKKKQKHYKRDKNKEISIQNTKKRQKKIFNKKWIHVLLKLLIIEFAFVFFIIRNQS